METLAILRRASWLLDQVLEERQVGQYLARERPRVGRVRRPRATSPTS